MICEWCNGCAALIATSAGDSVRIKIGRQLMKLKDLSVESKNPQSTTLDHARMRVELFVRVSIIVRLSAFRLVIPSF